MHKPARPVRPWLRTHSRGIDGCVGSPASPRRDGLRRDDEALVVEMLAWARPSRTRRSALDRATSGRSIGLAPPRDHRPRHGPSADDQRRRLDRDQPERRDLQLRRAARGAAAPRPHASRRTATPRSSPTSTRSSATASSTTCAGCSRSRSGTSARQRLVLARDRLGKKPLYWRLADGRLTYGSELKALLAEPDAPTDSRPRGARPVPRAISTSRRHGRSCAASTSCRPASILTWDGGEPRIGRYWAPDYKPKVDAGRSRRTARPASRCSREAVRLRLGATSRWRVPVRRHGLQHGRRRSWPRRRSRSERSPSGSRRRSTTSCATRAPSRSTSGPTTPTRSSTWTRSSLLPELADHYRRALRRLRRRCRRSASPQLAARVAQGRPDGRRRRRGVRRLPTATGSRPRCRCWASCPTPLHIGRRAAAQAVLSRTAAKSRLRRRADNWRRLATLDWTPATRA